MTREELLLDLIQDTIQGTEYEGQTFVAGGYVRDMIMGKQSKDVDLVITRPNGGIEFANWITKRFGCRNDTNPVIFPRFGTAKFNLRTKHFRDLSDVAVECVMPRSEAYGMDGRKPDVSFASLREDAERRDFTINSLFLNVSTREIVDYNNGQRDIENKIIRTAIDPEIIFRDDPLRMLRAVRFARRLNFRIDAALYNTIRNNADFILNISKERVQDELNKMLMTDRPSLAIRVLRSTFLLRWILPEIEALGGVTQNVYHVDDVFGHTMKVLDATPADVVTRLGALFHDVGKPITRSVGDDGRVHFYKHDEVGMVMAEQACRRLKYPTEVGEHVGDIVRDHMRLKDAGFDGDGVSDRVVRRFRKDTAPHMDALLDVMHADNICHAPEHNMPNQIPRIRERIANMKDVPAKPNLPINGNNVMQELGIKPGPMVKELLAAVEEAWMENPQLTRGEALRIVRYTEYKK